jgi:hypothetical protein
MTAMTTSIKAYANVHGYTDTTPYEIIDISPSGKQLTLRSMKCEKDTNWKAEWHVGGFAGHCANQGDQKWIIKSDEDGHTIKANKRKDGRFWTAYGKASIEPQPRKFHDYNF